MTAGIGHNGAPPTVDRDVPDMSYFKMFPGDFLVGTAHMSLEMRGAYITTLCVMYDRMGGFPYDEHAGAMLLRVDKRVYRRVRDYLLADGKFYRDGEMIRNARVEREISSYVTEYIRRSEAAKKREAERREKRTSPELRPNFPRTSPELPAEVHGKSPELEAKNPTKTTKPEAQADQIPESRIQNPEARIKKEKGGKVDLGLSALAADAAPSPSPSPEPEPRSSIDVQAAFNSWNALADRCGLQKSRTLTPQRRKAIAARIREHGGMAAWERALSMVERSAFLRGGNSRGWRATLDFLCQASSFAKVVDGAYGNGAHASAKPSEDALARITRLMGSEPKPESPRGLVEILPPVRTQ